jgi:hypothetical protein
MQKGSRPQKQNDNKRITHHPIHEIRSPVVSDRAPAKMTAHIIFDLIPFFNQRYASSSSDFKNNYPHVLFVRETETTRLLLPGSAFPGD